jgi:hypothetical protein
MNTRFLLLTLTLLFTVRIYARDKTDVMVMTNGDRPTCEVKGLDAGVLYVSFEAFTAPVRGLCAGQCVSPTLFILYRHRGTRQYLSRYTTFAKLITFAVELRPKYVGTEPINALGSALGDTPVMPSRLTSRLSVRYCVGGTPSRPSLKSSV